MRAILVVAVTALRRQDEQFLAPLYRLGPLSNQQFSTILHMSPSAVTNSLGRLVEAGTVVSVDARHFAGTVGAGERRKRTFRLNPDFGYALVVVIDCDWVVVQRVTFDLECTELRRVRLPDSHRDTILHTVETELSAVTRNSGTCQRLGLGFTMPGQVDSTHAIAVHNTRMELWEHVEFHQFSAYSPLVVAENVANAVAVGESLRGAARDVSDFLLLHIGNGAGMGIVINGELHRGHNHAAGEAGHVIVEESSGTTCSCGNRGCLESFVSRRAVMRELEHLRDSEVPSAILNDPELGSGEPVYRLLGKYHEQGDKVADLVVDELAHKLGLAAANFAQVLAPQRIVLSGPVSNLGQPFLERMERTLRRYRLPWLEPVPVVHGQDETVSAAQGAARMVFRRLLAG